MTYIIKFFLCGIICSFLFPPFFIFPLGFVVFPYLYFNLIDINLQKINKLSQFILGICFGLGLNLIVLYWIREPFIIDSTTEKYSYLSFLLIFYVSIYFGFVFLILSLFKNNFSKLIMMPVVFIVFEIIRENFVFGFPWVSFAVVASGNYYFLQLVYFIGTNGLSLFLIFLFLTPVVFYFLKHYEKNFFLKIYLLVFFIILFIVSVLIFFRLNSLNNQNNSIDIGFTLNQLNINQADRFNDLLKNNRIDEIINIIQNKNNTIHVFSETDYPFIIENNNIVDFFQKYLLDNNSIIIGGIRKDNKKYYNSLYFISKDNFHIFDKKILVPFGEFLPFRNQLKFLDVIVGNIDFKTGKKNRFIKTPYDFSFIPVICYEIIFFNDLLTTRNKNSPVLINITNDAWFGKFLGPYQHFYLSRIRSIEFNKLLIRVSNNGVSTIINNYGVIINHIPLNKKDMKDLRINFPSELTNFYNFHQLIYLVIFILIFISVIIERRIDKL